MLKVLFVCSRKTDSIVSPFIKSQAESLEKEGVEVTFFLIEKKGLIGYLQASIKLRAILNKSKFDIVHAHYSLSGFVASLAGAKKIVVSLMGSDVIKKNGWSRLIPLFNSFFRWRRVIVKSREMEYKINLKNSVVIPNGVDFNRFYAMDKNEARLKLNFEINQEIILFNGHKNNFIKNYQLAEKVIDSLNRKITLIELKSIPHEMLYLYFNACDLLLSTSKWEGSPNIIKEAMACNTPIVATQVGDIPFLFGENSGNFFCDFNVENLSEKVIYLLRNINLRHLNQGRNRLTELKLESHQIASRIFEIYKSCK
jgi:glycosyltransferase involved in cell wall biosynthesis